MHDELDRALHDLRLELNATMRPELSERASDFLSALTDGRYHQLELDQHYELLVVEDGQVKPVVSGGEEDMLHLVLRLAISQMVAERAGQPLSLLVLDEIAEVEKGGLLADARGLLHRVGHDGDRIVLAQFVDQGGIGHHGNSHSIHGHPEYASAQDIGVSRGPYASIRPPLKRASADSRHW
mgnify:CR=1 FL=1